MRLYFSGFFFFSRGVGVGFSVSVVRGFYYFIINGEELTRLYIRRTKDDSHGRPIHPFIPFSRRTTISIEVSYSTPTPRMRQVHTHKPCPSPFSFFPFLFHPLTI